MLKNLSKLFGIGENESDASGPDGAPNAKLMTAMVTLLVKAAKLDGDFSETERAHLVEVVTKHFNSTQDEVERLIIEAIKAVDDGTELYPVTKVVRDELEHDDRLALIEMLWEIVYADGELHDFEASLMRRVTGLVYVSDKESGDARRRAIEKLGLAD